MFRGAFILAMGYALGYAHAASQNEQISKTVQDLKQAWKDADKPTAPETGETHTEGTAGTA